MGSNKNYHYFYKITNLINGHFYYGVHSTNDLDDGYMGSGYRLKYAYKKYGIENFSKEILKFFDTKDDAYEYESSVVTEELVSNDECYNVVVGGVCGVDSTGKTVVRYKNSDRYFLIDSSEYDPDIYSVTWTGKKHTIESRNKIRNKMTPSNSKNKRIWICKDGAVKYVLKEKLDSFLEDGWQLGRMGYKPRKGMMGIKIQETEE